jgi:hypothetical protein
MASPEGEKAPRQPTLTRSEKSETGEDRRDETEYVIRKFRVIGKEAADEGDVHDVNEKAKKKRHRDGDGSEGISIRKE